MTEDQKEQLLSIIHGLSANQTLLVLEYAKALASSAQKPLWENRTSGREVSPPDFIKQHYGKWENGEWDRDGLTSAALNRSNRKLYLVYAQWIKRHPEDDLNLPKRPRNKITNAEEAVERHREASRRSYHRRKTHQEKSI